MEYLDESGNKISTLKALRQLALMMEGQRDEAILEKSKVQEENQNITQSISYASRIQDAMFGEEEDLKGLFHDSFIFFKPREIVSGDFYWFYEGEKDTK